MKNRPLIQITLSVFILFNAIIILGKEYLIQLDLKPMFLTIVNIMLFLMSLVNHIRLKNMDQQSSQTMVRNVMMGTILKLFVFAGAALIYATQKKAVPVGIPTLLVSMGLYIVYTYIEIKPLLKK